MKRRTFMKQAAAASAFTIIKPGLTFGSKANSAIRIGIIGCGSRGTDVITSTVKNTHSVIFAMADLFEDKLQSALPVYNKANTDKGLPAVQKMNIYKGAEAYLKLINNADVDAVHISTPAYAHPDFLEAAIKAGKHVYCEKPAAIDVEGCKKAQKIAAGINGKLSAVHGFQIRYATAYNELIKRIREGAIGKIINAQLYYLSSGVIIGPMKNMSYDEYRIRNHFHFNDLSGGTLLDQGIHILDVCNWALDSHPVRAIGTGSKKEGGEYGDAWNNYQVIYEYPGGINATIHTTQVGPEFGDVCARFIGTDGIAEVHYGDGAFIKGKNPWSFGSMSTLDDADQNKQKSYISSIESGNHINLLDTGCEATLSALLGREAAVRQEFMTWDELILSGEKTDPNLDLSQFDN
jgi:myo-inositol 2-dehydrogenase / D-chiro-inositol 1-dehydrogenase